MKIDSSIKSTRFVNDGEVDPSIEAMARVAMSQASFHEEPFSELDAWLFASRFGAYDNRVLDGMTTTMPWMYLSAKQREDAKTYGVTSWQVAAYVNKLKERWDENRFKLQTMLSLGPDDVIIQSLLFLHGDVENWPESFQQAATEGATVDDILTLAKNVASSVPPLGKTWLRNLLIKDGMSAGEAEAKAADVYARGSNLVAFEAQNDRRKVIAATLRLRDPGVSDEQIERVVMSPMSVEEVGAKFGGRNLGGPRSSGTGNGESGGGGGGALFLVAAAALGGLFLLKKKGRK